MYDELIGRLRVNGELFQKYIPNAEGEILLQAADAIEELSRDLDSMNEANIALYGALPKWIPVTERLPEHDKNVLICYEWTGRSRTVYREVGIASIEELERDPTEMFRPLYWMPLPEPPKEN